MHRSENYCMPLDCNCVISDYGELLQECDEHREANFMK